jgi:hypothetical protein
MGVIMVRKNIVRIIAFVLCGSFASLYLAPMTNSRYDVSQRSSIYGIDGKLKPFYTQLFKNKAAQAAQFVADEIDDTVSTYSVRSRHAAELVSAAAYEKYVALACGVAAAVITAYLNS